jgi:hypothetical protein
LYAEKKNRSFEPRINADVRRIPEEEFDPQMRRNETGITETGLLSSICANPF